MWRRRISGTVRMHSSAVIDCDVPTASRKRTVTSSGPCSMAWTTAPNRVSPRSAGPNAFGQRIRAVVDERQVAEHVLVVVGEPLDQREVIAALEVEQRAHQPERLLADLALDEVADQRIAVVALDDLLPAAGLDDHLVEWRHRVLEDVARRLAPLAHRQVVVERRGVERAAPDGLAVEVDERVLVVHRERRRPELEPLVDQVLAEPMLGREAHRPELAVHPAGEAAVGVDPAAEPVARLEDGDRVARFLEQQPGGQAGHPGPDDDDVLLRPVELREPGAEGFQQVESFAHG